MLLLFELGLNQKTVFLFDCFLLSSVFAANDKVCRFFLILARILAAFACGEAIRESRKGRSGLRCRFALWKRNRVEGGGSGNRKDLLLDLRVVGLLENMRGCRMLDRFGL